MSLNILRIFPYALLVLTLVCVPLSKGTQTTVQRDPKEIVFVDVQVVPMDREAIVGGQTVMVRNGRIVDIGPTARADVLGGAFWIDGRQRYLMPGLADMHTHTRNPDEFPLLIANGVTTIRNMFGAPLHVGWRQQIRDGRLLAPTIYTAGPIVNGHPPLWPGSAVPVTPDEADRMVAHQKAAGYDFVKVYWGLSPHLYEAVLAAARKHAMPVVGHVP